MNILLQHRFVTCFVFELFFFLQVLAKSAKVIPVMLMGKLVSRTQYKNYEYATALLISIGMTAFLLGSSEGKKGKTQKKTLPSSVLERCAAIGAVIKKTNTR